MSAEASKRLTSKRMMDNERNKKRIVVESIQTFNIYERMMQK